MPEEKQRPDTTLLDNSGQVVCETLRLRLRQATRNDARFIERLLNTSGWIDNIGDFKITDQNVAASYIEERLLTSYTMHSTGLWVVELKPDSTSSPAVSPFTPVGLCGLIKREQFRNLDVGYAILPEFQKMGYAYEAAKASLDYGYQVLRQTTIVGMTTEDNLPSRRLLEKLGMRYSRDVQFSETQSLCLFTPAATTSGTPAN